MFLVARGTLNDDLHRLLVGGPPASKRRYRPAMVGDLDGRRTKTLGGMARLSPARFSSFTWHGPGGRPPRPPRSPPRPRPAALPRPVAAEAWFRAGCRRARRSRCAARDLGGPCGGTWARHETCDFRAILGAGAARRRPGRGNRAGCRGRNKEGRKQPTRSRPQTTGPARCARCLATAASPYTPSAAPLGPYRAPSGRPRTHSGPSETAPRLQSDHPFGGRTGFGQTVS